MKLYRSVSLLVVCLAAVAALAATTHLPKANTRTAIEAWVNDAAAVVKAHGPSCATFASPEWRGGDYYIFVVSDDKLICHVTPSLIGTPNSLIISNKGEHVGTMLAEKAKGNGKGWVDYHWIRPTTGADSPKSSYVVGVTGPDGKHYMVGGGGWNVK